LAAAFSTTRSIVRSLLARDMFAADTRLLLPVLSSDVACQSADAPVRAARGAKLIAGITLAYPASAAGQPS
jgi:hypothetical protein